MSACDLEFDRPDLAVAVLPVRREGTKVTGEGRLLFQMDLLIGVTEWLICPGNMLDLAVADLLVRGPALA